VASVSELSVIIRGQDELSAKLSAIQNGLSGLGSKMQETSGHAGVFGTALSGALSVFTGGAILGAVSSGFGALSNFIKGGIADAKDANVIFAQSEAVIKSTGGAAGVTAQQVADYASALSAASGKSLFGDDQIAQSENLLLTFTNIKGKSLEAATAVSVDMAQAMGGAPKDAAIQLGKALNDPIAGISALSRVGVTFDAQQKANIATMMKHGDVAGAQGVILAELNKEFGGSAAAAAKADGGFAQFKDRMGELGESIGHQLEPVTRAFFAFLGGPGAAAIEAVTGLLVGGLTRALSFLTGSVLPPLIGIWSDIVDLWQTSDDITTGLAEKIGFVIDSLFGVTNAIGPFQAFGIVFDQVRSTIEDVGKALMSGNFAGAWQALILDVTQLGAEISQILLPALVSLGSRVLAWIVTEASALGAQLLSWGRAFVSWIVPMIAPALATLGQFAVSIGGWIATQASALGQRLLTWGQAFVAWIGPMIPPALAALGQLIVSIGAWAAAQVSVIAGRLLAWGQAFIAWVAPMIPPALAALGQFITSLGAWVVAQVPVLIGQLAAWGRSFVAWVAPMIAPALAALDGMAASLLAWIAAKAAPILAQLQTWAQAFVAWIGPAASDFLARWPGILNSFLNWIAGAAAPILSRLGDWARSFIAWIVPATVNFLQQWPGMLNQFLNWIGNAAGPLLVKLGEWALAFIKWIAPMIPPFLVALAGIALAIGTFVVETAVVLIAKLVQWGAAFLGWVATDVIPKLPGVLASILTTVSGWITTAAKTIVSEAASIGSSLVGGIKSGIESAWSSITTFVQTQINKIPKVIRDLMRISSPSQVMAEQVGVPIVEGMALGILQTMPRLLDAMRTSTNDVLQELYSFITTDDGKSTLNATGAQAINQLIAGMQTSTIRDSRTLGGVGTAVVQDVRAGVISANPLLGSALTTGLNNALRTTGDALRVGRTDGTFGQIGTRMVTDLANGITAAGPAIVSGAGQLGAQIGTAISNGIAGNLRFPDFQFGGAGQAHIGAFAQGGLSGGPAAVLPPGGGGTVIHPGAIVINAGSNVSAGDIANQVIAKIDQTSRTRR
jgi:hypothetical protein